MSAAVTVSPEQAALSELRQLVRECAELGARFRLSGAMVEIDGLDLLPAPLTDRLLPYAAKGWLWAYLGGERLDAPAIALGEQLGVRAVVVESRAEARQVVRALIADIAKYNGTLSLDIETAALPGTGAPQFWIGLKQNGCLAEHQKITRRAKGPNDRITLDPHRSVIATLQLYAGGEAAYLFRGEALDLVLRSHWLHRQTLIVHNAGFEHRFLKHHYNYRLPPGRRGKRGQLHCTMQATGLLHGVGDHGEGRSLADAAAKRLGLIVPKELARSDWAAPVLSPGQINYACIDPVIPYRLWADQRRELVETGLWDAYELQRGAVPAVADMELRGLGLDRDEHAGQVRLWDEELARERQAFAELTSTAPPSKNSEIIAWLRQSLDPRTLEHWPKTPTGQLSTRAGHLKRLISLDIPSAKQVLAIKKLEQLTRNFGVRLVEYCNPVTGRLHPTVKIGGAKSGRLSAEAPNLQQLPGKRAPDFKRCIVAQAGYVLVCADYDQVEFRAAGRIAKEHALDRLYEDGRDLHTETAARILGIPLDEVSKEQRANAKPIGFGAIYGMGAKSLREYAFADFDVDMTERQAEEALRRFFRPFPRLESWRHVHADLCQRRGYIEIGAGRVVAAEWEPFGLSFQQCCNLPIQGACADVMLRALRLVHRRLRRARLRGGLVASVHDELVLEIHQDDAEEAKAILTSSMVKAFTDTFPGAPVKGLVKVNIGRSWGDAKQ